MLSSPLLSLSTDRKSALFKVLNDMEWSHSRTTGSHFIFKFVCSACFTLLQYIACIPSFFPCQKPTKTQSHSLPQIPVNITTFSYSKPTPLPKSPLHTNSPTLNHIPQTIKSPFTNTFIPIEIRPPPKYPNFHRGMQLTDKLNKTSG